MCDLQQIHDMGGMGLTPAVLTVVPRGESSLCVGSLLLDRLETIWGYLLDLRVHSKGLFQFLISIEDSKSDQIEFCSLNGRKFHEYQLTSFRLFQDWGEQ